MDDNALINENELPRGIPSTDSAWNDMRTRLEDEMPERVVPIPFAETPGFRKWSLVLILVLVSVCTWIIVNDNSKQRSSIIAKSNTNPVTAVNKEKIAAGETQTNRTTNTISGSLTIRANQGELNADTTKPASGALAGNPERDKKTYRNNSAGYASGSSAPAGKKTDKKTKRTSRSISYKNRKNKFKTISGEQETLSSPGGFTEGENTTAISKTTSIKKDTGIVIGPTATNKVAATENKSPSADSTASTIAETDHKQKGWKLQTGLQWVFQLPTIAGSAYVEGTNTKSQPWRLLLPGLWLQAINENKLLTLEVNPFFSNLVPAKTFRTVSTSENIADTIVNTTQTKTLRKLFGVSAVVGYDINITGNW